MKNIQEKLNCIIDWAYELRSDIRWAIYQFRATRTRNRWKRPNVGTISEVLPE